MPIKFDIVNTRTGAHHQNFGGMISETSREIRTLVRGVLSRNLGIFTQLLADLWINVVQKTTWERPTPSPRGMIIADVDLSTSSVSCGWADYPEGDAARRIAERRKVYSDEVREMLRNYNFLAPSSKAIAQRSRAYREHMGGVSIYPRPPRGMGI